MRVVIDVEANALHNPTRVWCIVCKDIDKGEYHVFHEDQLEGFRTFSNDVSCFIGHNILGWDSMVLNLLVGVDITSRALDTLILSKMIDYPRDGHSIEDYGREFGIEKGKHNDFSKYSPELEAYCIRDVDISHQVYRKYQRYVNNPNHARAIKTEHDFQNVVNSLSHRGFAFNQRRAKILLENIQGALSSLDEEIQDAFPPKLKMVREVHPRYTRHGTLDKKDFRWVKSGDLSEFNGGPFCRCLWKPFNASSHKQIIDILFSAGWSPTEKTQALKDASKKGKVDQSLQKYGWKVNETNLATLPEKAPKPARLLSKRILLESRRRSLTEWLGLVKDDGRVYGDFYGIGAWTHRMSHSKPNMANIPTGDKLYGKDFRALFKAPRDRLLVGVDAESIQLRIFAHYINDKEFTNALVSGNKADKTDPHSLNKNILGDVCKSRDAAKTFIYAMLLGGRPPKFAEIFGSSIPGAEEAYNRILTRYPGLKLLKEEVTPKDAKRGWFEGLDGRRVKIPGDTMGQRAHLAMAGYLQNGEAVIMKMAANRIFKMIGQYDAYFVNFVHDEFQFECPNDHVTALLIAKEAAESIKWAGEELGLRCPTKGSYWSDHNNDYTIGINWSQTH